MRRRRLSPSQRICSTIVSILIASLLGTPPVTARPEDSKAVFTSTTRGLPMGTEQGHWSSGPLAATLWLSGGHVYGDSTSFRASWRSATYSASPAGRLDVSMIFAAVNEIGRPLRLNVRTRCQVGDHGWGRWSGDTHVIASGDDVFTSQASILCLLDQPSSIRYQWQISARMTKPVGLTGRVELAAS